MKKPTISSLSNRKKSMGEDENKAPLISPAENEKKEPGFRVNGAEPDETGDSKKTGAAGGSFNVKISGDGKIENLDSMRPRTIENFRNALRNTPGAMERILGAIGSTALQVIEPRQIEPFYTGIGMVNTFLAIKFAGIHPAIAGQFIPYSEHEKELLCPATAEAINENIDKCPAWLLKILQGGGSVSLAKLAMLLFEIHAQKLQLVKAATVEASIPQVKAEPAVN